MYPALQETLFIVRPLCTEHFAAYRYKLLYYHRRNLFVCVSDIARPSGRNRVGLYEGSVRYRGHCSFQYMYRTCNIFLSLPSRVGCSFQGKLFSIFKLLCFVFVRYHLSFRSSLENCVLFGIALRSS